MKMVVKVHGILKSIVSDRDKVFISQFWRHLWKISGTTLNMSIAYHPQSDRQSEVLNKCVEMYLRCLTFEALKDWSKLLLWAKYWYNIAYHASAGMTPFKIVYGRDLPSIVKYTVDMTDPISVRDQLLTRDAILKKLKRNLHRAQQI